MSEKQNSTNEEATLQLHKEALQISKKVVQTSDVKVYKRSYTEEKQILIPVRHEELVIEKRKLNEAEAEGELIETIRIPLSEERIEVTLHPTVLEDVEIYKQQFEEVMKIQETLKEEKARINTVGKIRVIEDDQ
ncbi:YsnF/AvaK domain-containing protein [Mesobacillus foraminis]|uniref:YsnF/AvaK domain-containing protein n=1 Tax=Mesobacillus foraminis TaxID=279826 RepID=UPI001BE8B95B|nr:YsnF/AvaK domain-containing protein [Mesobacillus foraminis]MBT2758471.1 YsnF/AvaK domain-containing protein [Mesobacillus foraminis]